MHANREYEYFTREFSAPKIDIEELVIKTFGDGERAVDDPENPHWEDKGLDTLEDATIVVISSGEWG